MRSKRFKKINRGSKTFEVDITSLLDILVILLVFLLKSYNPSDLKLQVAKGISIPESNSQTLGHLAVIVQVSRDKDLWINNKKIGKIQQASEKINLLYDQLTEIKNKQNEKIKELELNRSPSSQEKDALKWRKESNKKINIVLDQSLPYSMLRKVMHTSALAGFPEFKFIVQGNF